MIADVLRIGRIQPRWLHSGLVFAYGLSALLASGYHAHPEESHAAPALIADCCVDRDVHLENHPDAPDLSPHFTSCPACQYRLDNLAFLGGSAESGCVLAGTPALASSPTVPVTPVARVSCRAPPVA